MNKYIILLVIISLFSCERKKPATADQIQTTIPEVKEVVSEQIEKIEKVVDEETKTADKVDKTVSKTKELIAKETIAVLPKTVFFGDIKVDISELNGNIVINSNNEFMPSSELPFKGKADALIETDVDGNGFNEFYIVSNTGDLAAFSSYGNKSFGEIYIAKKPFTFYENSVKVKFWEAKNKKLSITFENRQGELNTVRYKLKVGEASYQLVAE